MSGITAATVIVIIAATNKVESIITALTLTLLGIQIRTTMTANTVETGTENGRETGKIMDAHTEMKKIENHVRHHPLNLRSKNG